MPGVYESRKKDGTRYYRVSITFHSKHISLGSHTSAKEASEMYHAAYQTLHSDAGIASYPENRCFPLDFCRYVSLINFRESGIYIKNPIMLHKSFFSYYIDPELELKFDMDDLFYYSSHAIMKRGNHFFVADYGLQENVASRYGIRSYATAGRDYIFVNGDNTDFRYLNIKIINRFTGITAVNDSSDTVYAAKIHINGDWKLGTFPTEEAAAVAYNKALDEIKKRKLKPKSLPLFIETLTARQYADLYSKITLPDKLLAYLSAYDMKHMS